MHFAKMFFFNPINRKLKKATNPAVRYIQIGLSIVKQGSALAHNQLSYVSGHRIQLRNRRFVFK
jgi:hypothetical protein